jgi:hypothetical protein
VRRLGLLDACTGTALRQLVADFAGVLHGPRLRCARSARDALARADWTLEVPWTKPPPWIEE